MRKWDTNESSLQIYVKKIWIAISIWGNKLLGYISNKDCLNLKCMMLQIEAAELTREFPEML